MEQLKSFAPLDENKHNQYDMTWEASRDDIELGHIYTNINQMFHLSS